MHADRPDEEPTILFLPDALHYAASKCINATKYGKALHGRMLVSQSRSSELVDFSGALRKYVDIYLLGPHSNEQYADKSMM